MESIDAGIPGEALPSKILKTNSMKLSSLIVCTAMATLGTLSVSGAENNKFVRTMVVEEHTGTWCVWCPRGYVGMEYMREHYGDANYIGIAIHVSSGATDPMHCTTYAGYMQKYQNGFPNCTVNRVSYCDPTKYNLEAEYRKRAELVSPAAISITADASAGESVDTEVTVEMLNDTPYHTYGIAWVITEDNVGPYKQKNGYAGSDTPMGGFEDMGSYASVIFNDVARRIVDWKGNRNVLPAAMEAGKQYTVNRTVSLAEVAKISNANVIALLIDTATGEIITGAKTSLGDSASVTEVAQRPRLHIDGNTVSLGQDCDAVTIYTLTGSRAAYLQPGQSVTLPAGVYIAAGTKLVIK